MRQSRFFKLVCNSGIILIVTTTALCVPWAAGENPIDAQADDEGLLGENTGLSVTNLTFDDRCYKGTTLLRPFEWWYFDAIFTNQYSVEFHLIVAQIKGRGVIAPMLNIYQDGSLVRHIKKFFPLTDFSASVQQPHILIQGTPFMRGYQDDTGNWIFDVSLHLEDSSINLTFTSVTQGWKSNILGMWMWGVIQPKATVTGILQVNGKIIPVSGTGYHEHGWNATIPHTQGWYWGKFIGDSYNIIWTYIMEYPWVHHTLMVVNDEGAGYHVIPPENIKVTLSNYTDIEGTSIPTTFHLQSTDTVYPLSVMVTARSITHQTSISFFNYWRYHVLIQGTLQAKGHSIPIDTFQIMDYTHIW